MKEIEDMPLWDLAEEFDILSKRMERERPEGLYQQLNRLQLLQNAIHDMIKLTSSGIGVSPVTVLLPGIGINVEVRSRMVTKPASNLPKVTLKEIKS